MTSPESQSAQSKGRIAALQSDMTTEEIPPHTPVDLHEVCPVGELPKSDAATTAVDSWFESHHRRLVAFLSLRFKSQERARDLAQQAYERVRRAAPACRGEELKRYVFKVAINLGIDSVRHEKREDTRIQTHVETDGESKDAEQEMLDEEEQALTAEQSRRLPEFLLELPEKYQIAVAEYTHRGNTQKQIAKLLGVSERMVNNYISYTMVYCRLRLSGVSKEEAWKHRRVRP